MSWTRRPNPYQDFRDEALKVDDGPPGQPVPMLVWEYRDGDETGTWLNSVTDPSLLQQPCTLRIVFPPLDIPLQSNCDALIRLFEALHLPPAFVAERLRSVSFSFGSQRDPPGRRPAGRAGPPSSSCAWFHFLCKNIDIVDPHVPVEAGGRPAVRYNSEADVMRETRKRRATAEARADDARDVERKAGGGGVPGVSAHTIRMGGAPGGWPKDRQRWKRGLRYWFSNRRAKEPLPLPQSDFSYLRSGFFLRVNDTVSSGSGDGRAGLGISQAAQAPDLKTEARSKRKNGDVTLVVFGVTEHVWDRFEDFFIAAHDDPQVIQDVLAEPYSLFDIILDGLSVEIDKTVWRLNGVFGPFEHDLLATATSNNREMVRPSAFVGLHNLAKHAIHLTEALEASLMLCAAVARYVEAAPSSRTHGLDVVDTVDFAAAPTLKKDQEASGAAPVSPASVSPASDAASDAGHNSKASLPLSLAPPPVMSPSHAPTSRAPLLRDHLRAQLAYRTTLFRSTRLRLGSLEQRLANSIALSFNLLSQQDSRVMMRDSGTMKTLAGITMIFLPCTAVASVVGSQLFIVTQSGDDGGGGSNATSSGGGGGGGDDSWDITPTPLFAVLWYAAVPMTLLVIIGSWLLQRGYGVVERREREEAKRKRVEERNMEEEEKRLGALDEESGAGGKWARFAGLGGRTGKAGRLSVVELMNSGK